MTIHEKRMHVAATIMRMMSIDEMEELEDSIKKNGLLVPISLWNGLIIDGRHRYRACMNLGIEPTFVEVDTTVHKKPAQYVLSMHERRNDTLAQKAMSAARAANLELGNVAAQKKPKSNGSKNNSGTAYAVPEDQKTSIDETAVAMKVSRGSVERGKSLLKTGSPELIAAVESGSIPLNTATEFAKSEPDKAKQDEFANKGVVEIRKATKEAKAKSLTHNELEAGHKRRALLALGSFIREADDFIELASPENGSRVKMGYRLMCELANAWETAS